MNRNITNVDLMTDEEKEALRDFEKKIGKIRGVQEMADKYHELHELLSKVPTDNEIQKRYDKYFSKLENIKIE